MSAGSRPAPRTRRWVSFVDDDGEEWLFDLSFLTSSWTCIFGRGCPGIDEEPAVELERGCCSHGAHFADDDDMQRVAEAVARLDDSTWQYRSVARRRGGPFKQNGDHTVSRLVDGACIFLNRPGFATGAGCALHAAALAAGERPLDWKPEVCWQVPLRLSFHVDENDRTTNTLRAWDREDWGGGGVEFGWWCTEHDADPTPFVASDPVYVGMRDEIVEMIGADRYETLVSLIENEGSHDVAVAPPVLKNRP